MPEPFHILLPFWGRFDHFRIAVESVLAQTDGDWRLTVIDDAYPDTAPGEWLVGLGDPRIEYRRNTENRGVGATFRLCGELMRGRFGSIMGCDDRLLPDYVAHVRELIAAHPLAAVIQPGVEVIDGNGAVAVPLVDRVKRAVMPRGASPRLVSGEPLAASLLQGNWAYFPSLVWNVNVLNRFPFDADATIVPDLQLLLDIVAAGEAMVIDDRRVFQYRRHRDSVSSAGAARGWRFEEERSFFNKQRSRFEILGWKRAARAARMHWTSRLHAATRVPRALVQVDRRSAGQLIRHTFT